VSTDYLKACIKPTMLNYPVFALTSGILTYLGEIFPISCTFLYHGRPQERSKMGVCHRLEIGTENHKFLEYLKSTA